MDSGNSITRRGFAPGPEKGHFGISNMRERAARSGMTLTFGQKRGYVAVTLQFLPKS